MDITIHSTFLPHDDPDASLAFYRDTLGFEVRNDVGYGRMRWITVGPADQPDTSIVLEEPAHDVGGGRLVTTVTDPDGNVLGLLQDRYVPTVAPGSTDQISQRGNLK